MTNVRLKVNGRDIEAAVDPRQSLADFLREVHDLRSVHLGCEHGVCGACTVLIDGQIARSCIALTVALEGRDIWTLEGLENDPVIRILRDAFHQRHGLQCGYCTPAMLITARDLIARKTIRTEESVREALAGNICRCTGYSGIVRAIMLAMEQIDREAMPAH